MELKALPTLLLLLVVYEFHILIEYGILVCFVCISAYSIRNVIVNSITLFFSRNNCMSKAY